MKKTNVEIPIKSFFFTCPSAKGSGREQASTILLRSNEIFQADEELE
ncbi:MAG: hypothetical protein ACR2NK_14150 [Mariniblastus sp.]